MNDWSKNYTVTGYSDTVFADLTTAVQAHLDASAKRLFSIQYYTSSLVTLTHFAIIVEEN